MSEAHPTDDFLNHDFACAPPEPLRAVLRERTTGVLRRRRRSKRAAVALLLLIAGAGLGWSLATFTHPNQPPAEGAVRVVVVEVKEPGNQATPVPPKEPPGSASTPLEHYLSPAQRLEVQARRDVARQAVCFLQAGDRYFEDDDCAAALRSYTSYLNLAGPEALAAALTDNWLLASLKNARKKEQIHAE
jgi:hypothetical protein